MGRRPSRGAATQLALWEQQGMLPFIDPARLTVYRLLAGEVDDVTPHLHLDWQRALGLRLWWVPGAPAPIWGVQLERLWSVVTCLSSHWIWGSVVYSRSKLESQAQGMSSACTQIVWLYLFTGGGSRCVLGG